MNRERIEAWVSALESGEYVQVTYAMREPLYDKDDKVVGVGYCALGVGMKVAEQHGMEVVAVDWLPGRFTFEVREWYGLTEADPRVGIFHVSDLNDNGTSFWDIAQMLRAKYLKEEG